MRDIKSFTSVFIHREPVDMRRGINGLSEIVQLANMGSLKGNYLFIFCGRRRNSIKILYFDKSGFALWQRSWKQTSFRGPESAKSFLKTTT